MQYNLLIVIKNEIVMTLYFHLFFCFFNSLVDLVILLHLRLHHPKKDFILGDPQKVSFSRSQDKFEECDSECTVHLIRAFALTNVGVMEQKVKALMSGLV